MKKFTAILICIISIFTLFSCSKPEDTPNEAAMKMYKAALADEIKVKDVHYGELNLRDYIFQINDALTKETLNVKHAVLDLDRDGIDEFIIGTGAGENIILTYRQGSVYCQRFQLNNLLYVNTDGSYGWDDGASDTPIIYGESRFEFKDGKFVEQELWYILNDGRFNAEYFVAGESVAKDAIERYREENQKTKLTFDNLELKG